jgi:LysR family glycine cleavage system transcriptional activator
LPPFAAIRAFEAAARHLSFKDAAAEICALTEVLDRLDAGTERVAGTGADRPLAVLCTPGFAARWLAPRIARCPEPDRVRVEVSTGAPSTDFAANDADLVIAWGAPAVPGVVVEPLMESSRYPVCSPEFRARTGVSRPEDLLRQTLFHDEVMDAWDKWFALAGVTPPGRSLGPRLPHCELTLTAAEQGQGVALAYDAMARGGLKAGRLVRLFDVTVPPITIYSVAYPVARKRCPRIGAFRDWIFDEVLAEGTLDRQTRVLAAS